MNRHFIVQQLDSSIRGGKDLANIFGDRVEAIPGGPESWQDAKWHIFDREFLVAVVHHREGFRLVEWITPTGKLDDLQVVEIAPVEPRRNS